MRNIIDRIRSAFRDRKRLVPLLLLSLVAIALVVSMNTALRNTAWSSFSNDEGLTRSALDPDLRTVLWSGPEPAPARFNVPSDIRDPCFSPDGLTMVFARTPKKQDGETLDLFFCHWTGHQWTNMSAVSGINLSDANEISPAFSWDGSILYFASDRPGGQGGYDLWAARWDQGKCSWVTNLGPALNSAFNETDPALSPNDLQLFFSSDRTASGKRKKKLNDDIFVATRASEKTTAAEQYGDVKRVDGLCSRRHDRQPVVTRHGDFLYFASNRGGGTGGFDIYVSRIRAGQVGEPENLTSQVNSRFDDNGPAVRSEGYELMFAANRRLRRTVMREVYTDLDLTRAQQLLSLIDRIKWWILAVVGAACLLIYLLRHWRDFNSLFQKCLVGSVVVHLLVLLLLAGIFIASEVSETSKAVAMEVAIDADALAQEKMAVDMQEDLVEMTPTDIDVLVEQVQPDVELPEFTPQEMASQQPIIAQTSEDSFAAKATPSKAAPEALSDPRQSALELADLPAMDLPDLDFKMEEAAQTPVEPETKEAEPETHDVQEAVTVAFAEQTMELEAPQTPAEDVSALVEPTQEPLPPEPLPDPKVSRTESRESIPEPAAASSLMDPFAELETIEAPLVAISMEVPEEYVESDQTDDPIETAQPKEKMTIEFTELASAIESEANPVAQTTDERASNVVHTAFSIVAIDRVAKPTATESSRMTDLASATTPSTLEALAQLDAAVRALTPDISMEMPDRYVSTEDHPTPPLANTTHDMMQKTATAAFVDHDRLTDADPPTRREADALAARVTQPTDPAQDRPAAVAGTVKESRRRDQPMIESRTLDRFDVPDLTTPQSIQIPSRMETPTTYRRAARTEVNVGSHAQKAAQASFTEHARLTASSKSPASRTAASVNAVAAASVCLRRTVTAAATVAKPVPRKDSDLSRSGLSQQFSKPSPAATAHDVRPDPTMETPTQYVSKMGGAGKPKLDARRLQSHAAEVFREHGRLSTQSGPSAAMSVQASRQVQPQKIADTGGTIVVASAGIESRGALPEMKGTGETVSLAMRSAIKGPQLRINALGKLDVPSGRGDLIAPTVLRKPGTLSTEVIEGLGGSDSTQRSIASALTWFEKTQERDGHWDIEKHGGEKGHDVATTSLILLCYYGWGATHTEPGPHQEIVKKALTWLIDEMAKDDQGNLTGELTGKGGNLYDHALGTIALCEAYTLSKDKALEGPARKTLEYVIHAQNLETGGWRYVPREDSDILVTGWQYLALKSARMAGFKVDEAVLNRANRWIDACAGTAESGIYSYQPGYKHQSGTVIATGMFSRQLAGWAPTDSRMQKSAAYLHSHPFKAQGMDTYYLYYGTLSLYQHQGRKWQAWNRRMKDILPSLQCKSMFKSGSKSGSWNPSGHLGPKMGRAVTTAMCTLSLEVYYRILPMYGFRDADAMDEE